MPPESNRELSDALDAAAGKQRGAPGATEYKVGPGCPPKEFQFKKGQSGNPKGAKRKAPLPLRDIKRLLEQVLNRTISVTQGERKRTLTLLEAGIEQLVNQFVKGDRHARNELFKRAEQVGLDLLRPHEETSQPPGDALRKDQGDLTREDVSKLTDEEIELLIKAEQLKTEIRTRRRTL